MEALNATENRLKDNQKQGNINLEVCELHANIIYFKYILISGGDSKS